MWRRRISFELAAVRTSWSPFRGIWCWGRLKVCKIRELFSILICQFRRLRNFGREDFLGGSVWGRYLHYLFWRQRQTRGDCKSRDEGPASSSRKHLRGCCIFWMHQLASIAFHEAQGQLTGWLLEQTLCSTLIQAASEHASHCAVVGSDSKLALRAK